MAENTRQTKPAGGGRSVMRIDSHIHLWDLSIYKRRDWLQNKPQLIRDFSPADAAVEFESRGVTHGIIVEAAKYSLQDNIEWLRSAHESPRLLGAITGCYLEDPKLAEVLEQYAQWGSFLGVRATPSREVNQWDNLSLIHNGLEELSNCKVAFDILARPQDLKDVTAIAERFPELTIVVDHCGMPDSQSLASGEWTEGVCSLAGYQNIFMKYSGMAMIGKGLEDEAFFHSVAETLYRCFGSSRLIWGSNWPVDSLWAGYDADFDFSRKLLPERLEESELQQIYGGNALRAFNIDPDTGGRQL